MEKETVVQVGGNIDSALSGDYQIDISSVLSEAWTLTKTSRLAINLGLVFVLVIGMIISLIASSYMGGIEVVISDPQSTMILNVIVTLLIWPFIAGIEMMGVLQAVGIKTNFKLTFAFLKRGSWVALCALLTSLLISIGFNLLILPGIFLAVALSLTIPLVVEKGMTPMKAIVLCIKALRFKWFQIFAIYLSLVFVLLGITLPLVLMANSSLAFIGIVLFFFGLSYLAPVYYNVKGILYREIFGMTIHAVDAKQVNSDTDNTFSA